MTDRKSNVKATNLRMQAEMAAWNKADQPPDAVEALSPREIERIFHELRVHQIELEMQNEEIRHTEFELEKARERYIDLYDLAPVGYVTLDEQGVILEANLTACVLLSTARDDMVGQHLSKFIEQEDHDSHYLHCKQLLETGMAQGWELRMQKKNGKTIWVLIAATVGHSAGGKQIILTTMSDITERKQAEIALREGEALALRSETRLKKAQSIAHVGDWIWNIKEGQVEWSDEMYSIFGIEKDTYNGRLGDAITKVIHPDDLYLVLPSNASNFAEKKTVEYRIIHQDGSIRHILAETGDVIRGRDGIPNYLTGTCQDITEQKRTGEILRESEANLRMFIQHAPASLAMFDCQMNYQVVSQRWITDYHLEGQEILGKSHYEIFPEISEELKEVHRRGMAGEVTRVEEDKFTRANGEIQWLKWEVRPWFRDNQTVGGIIIFSEDITERMRAEEEKQLLYGQLLQAQKMESVGRLAGGIAHDFNNLLGVIIGRAESALAKDAKHQPVNYDLQEIKKAGDRSAELIRQLLAFSRKQPVKPTLLDLNIAISNIIEMLRRLIGEDIELTWIQEPETWFVRMDPSQVDQVLTNLLVNARDAIMGMGKIGIETSNIRSDAETAAKKPGLEMGEYVRLSVSDNGSGMDEVTRSHLFEPFFTTKEMGKGTGLGLSTVFGIVKQNNGTIEVDSQPGQGSTFRIYLPRLKAEAEPLAAAATDNMPRGGGETILMVDDEWALLEMEKEALEDLGYTVLAAGTAAEALRLGQEYGGKIRLLISDVIMPGMNGQTLSECLRSTLPDLKCLFMSGYTADLITDRGVVPEGIDFIQKPFLQAALALKVRGILDHNQRPTATAPGV